MGDSTGVSPTDKIKEIEEDVPFNPDDYTVEQLFLMVKVDRFKYLDDKIGDNLSKLSDRQTKAAKLQDLIAAINAKTVNGKVTVEKGSDLEKMLNEAKAEGIAISKTDGEFDSSERERVIENVRMKVSEYTTKTEMDFQAVNRATNERHQTIQMAYSSVKTLSDLKKTMARNAGGR